MGGKAEDGAIWGTPGATFSDKSARKEFGLTQEQILKAIRCGKLRYRVNDMHGNPWFRLIRSEVEALVKEKHGAGGLEKKKLECDLAATTRELRSLKRKITALEKKKGALLARLGQ